VNIKPYAYVAPLPFVNINVIVLALLFSRLATCYCHPMQREKNTFHEQANKSDALFHVVRYFAIATS
jgi:hypothetical protein